jgi:hypothetical protein
MFNHILVLGFTQKPPGTLVFLQLGPWNLFLAKNMRLSSVLGVLYVHAIVVMRIIVLA